MISQEIGAAAAYAVDVIVWSGYCELIEPLEASLGYVCQLVRPIRKRRSDKAN